MTFPPGLHCRQRHSRSEKFGGLSELLMDKNRPRFGKRSQLPGYPSAQLPGYLAGAEQGVVGPIPELDGRRRLAPLALLVGYQE